MKCIDCGHEFLPKKSEKNLKAELSNPGIVMFKGKVIECPCCSGKYTKEEDIIELLDNFEESHKEKHKLFSKS
jgi:DNA-directed RNA polymerase subunit RPC12/RpoP